MFLKEPGREYRKHVYWLRPEEADLLVRELEAEGIKVRRARGVLCTPLDELNRITLVPPAVWSETCSRPGSWYRASDLNGLSLVVSSFELEKWRQKRAAIITRSDFTPPRAATREEKEELIRDPAFASRVPSEWGFVSQREKRVYLRWARRLSSEVQEYDLLFLTHTANHANFLKPRFFVQDEQGVVPFSIDASAHLCSCCLELFQVLGREHERKLVRPCPGAVVFARLRPDEYLLVQHPQCRPAAGIQSPIG